MAFLKKYEFLKSFEIHGVIILLFTIVLILSARNVSKIIKIIFGLVISSKVFLTL